MKDIAIAVIGQLGPVITALALLVTAIASVWGLVVGRKTHGVVNSRYDALESKLEEATEEIKQLKTAALLAGNQRNRDRHGPGR